MTDDRPPPASPGRLHPTQRLWLLALVPAAVAVFACLDRALSLPLVVADGLILTLALLDAWLARTAFTGIQVEATVPTIWSHHRAEELVYRLEQRQGRDLVLMAAPDLPRSFAVTGTPWRLMMPTGGVAELRCRVTAQRRGGFILAGLHLAARSPLGCWWFRRRLGTDHLVRVYPNLKQLGDYALLARTDRLNLIGVRGSRVVGGDTEFERLRDHHGDDPLGRIDWKATARRDRLTVRDYQISQSQRVVLLIDAGRMMAGNQTAAGGTPGTLLDSAIDAALLLAYVALHRGDRVGLIAYANGIRRYVPARAGARHLDRLIHAVHDLEPELVESRHDEAFLYLQRKERQRSLAILLTHVIDEVNVRMLERHLTEARRRHLPLAVLLRDEAVHGRVATAPADGEDFWNAAAAAHLATWRAAALRHLHHTGALTVDTAAKDLTPALINRYLTIKARHLL